jgi:hypothetical protein
LTAGGDLNQVGLGSGSNSGAGLVKLGCDGATKVGLGSQSNLDPIAIQTPSSVGLCPPQGPIIERLDELISKKTGPQQGVVYSSLSDDNTSSDPSCGSKELGSYATPVPKGRQGRARRNQSPFPGLLGPKCIRFADAINNSVLAQKRKKVVDLQQGSVEPQVTILEGSLKERVIEEFPSHAAST